MIKYELIKTSKKLMISENSTVLIEKALILEKSRLHNKIH
jgi:hypothetical protein